MRKLHLVIPALLSLLALHCVKKQFVPFEIAHSVMLLKPGTPVEILQEPLKKEMIAWNGEKPAHIAVEGLLRVTYKDVDYFYLQLNCPQELKCNGKKAYIPRNLTHAANRDHVPFKSEYKEAEPTELTARFFLAETDQISQFLYARSWFASTVKKEVPMAFDSVLMAANTPAGFRAASVGNLYYLAQSVTKGEYPEKISPQFLREYPAYEEIVKSKGGNLNVGQKLCLRLIAEKLEEEQKKLMRQLVDNFPFTHSSYKQMATAFNTINAPQMLRAELAARIMEKSPFIVKLPGTPAVAPGMSVLSAQDAPTAAATPTLVEVTKSPKTGVTFSFDAAGKKQKIQLAEFEIAAFATDKGLGFQLGADKNDAVILEPAEESLFLRSGNQAEIQKFIKEIPDYKQTAKDFDLDLALLRLAMKYGKGSINRESGMFEYEIDLSKGRNFWVVLAALKHRFGTDAEDVYSGKIPPYLTPGGMGEADKGKIVWYQKYDKDSKSASIGIKGNATYCSRECWSVSVDTVCATNEDKLKVLFRPAAIFEKNGDPDDTYRELRNVRADFRFDKDNAENSCNRYLRLARTDDKLD